MTNEKIVKLVLATAGGMRPLGRVLGLKYQSIQKWKKVPAERVIAVERATGLDREVLRPDLFLAPRPRKHHAPGA